MDKKLVYTKLLIELQEKQRFLISELKALTSSLETSSKSSAGDKHETDTAMNQLAQEQLHKQFGAVQMQLDLLNQLNPSPTHTRCAFGSLVQTSKNHFFISVGIGKISVDNYEVICINLQSPVGQLLHKKTVGEDLIIGNEQHEIVKIS